MTEKYKKNKKDLYAALGVPRSADAAQIKKAYRKLAKKYHPDSNAGDAEAERRFKEISEANAILGDEEKRRIYDEFGFEAFESGMDPKEYAKRMREAQRAGFGSSGGKFGGGSGFHGFWDSFAGAGAEGFGTGSGSRSGFFQNRDGSYSSFHFEGGGTGDGSSLFEDLLKNGGRDTGGSRGSRRWTSSFGDNFGRGSAWNDAPDLDAEIPVSISFREAVLGCDRDIRLQKADGGGTQTLRVHIPAGIDDGKSVRLRGKGHLSADGAQRGDLLLKVSVEQSREFTRKGNDLYTTVNVPFSTAVLGGETEVRTPDGRKILCKVPQGTDAGKKIRIRGRGIHPEKSSARPGDLYVTVQVQIPKDLTDAEIRRLRDFEALIEKRRCGERHGPKTETDGRAFTA